MDDGWKLAEFADEEAVRVWEVCRHAAVVAWLD
jgi:hypothetical protein